MVQYFLKHVQIVKKGNNRTWTILACKQLDVQNNVICFLVLHVNGSIILEARTDVTAIIARGSKWKFKTMNLLRMHRCLACKWFNTSWKSTYRLLKEAIIAREPFIARKQVVGGSKQWICCRCTIVLHVNGSILLEALTDCKRGNYVAWAHLFPGSSWLKQLICHICTNCTCKWTQYFLLKPCDWKSETPREPFVLPESSWGKKQWICCGCTNCIACKWFSSS